MTYESTMLNEPLDKTLKRQQHVQNWLDSLLRRLVDDYGGRTPTGTHGRLTEEEYERLEDLIQTVKFSLREIVAGVQSADDRLTTHRAKQPKVRAPRSVRMAREIEELIG